MRKFFALILMVTVILSISTAVFAVPANLTEFLQDNPTISSERNIDVPVDIKMAVDGSGYTDGPVDKTGSATVDYKATLYTNVIRATFNSYKSAAAATFTGDISHLASQFNNCRITGGFTIKIIYPDSAVIPDAVLSGNSLAGFTGADVIFNETSRTVTDGTAGTKVLTITINILGPAPERAGYVKVSEMIDSYLPDITFTCAGVKVSSGENKVVGQVIGTAFIHDETGGLVAKMNFTGKQGTNAGITADEISETINITGGGSTPIYPGGGGGSTPIKPVDPKPVNKILEVTSDNHEVEVKGDELKGKESVIASTKTQSGLRISTALDISGIIADSLRIITSAFDASPIGLAAANMIGSPLTITAQAIRGTDATILSIGRIEIPTDRPAYVFRLLDNGIPVRTDSVYNENRGLIEMTNIPSGASILISSHKPIIFTDTISHWAENDINFVSDLGIVNGRGLDAFDPDGKLTRAEQAKMMTMLANIAGVEVKQPTDKDAIDTQASHWGREFVRIAYANSWLNGVGESSGVPIMAADDHITKEQMITTMWRLLGSPEAKAIDSAKFVDANNISDWAADAMSWAIGEGIIQGSPVDGRFEISPTKEVTRAETCKIYKVIISSNKL